MFPETLYFWIYHALRTSVLKEFRAEVARAHAGAPAARRAFAAREKRRAALVAGQQAEKDDFFKACEDARTLYASSGAGVVHKARSPGAKRHRARAAAAAAAASRKRARTAGNSIEKAPASPLVCSSLLFAHVALIV